MNWSIFAEKLDYSLFTQMEIGYGQNESIMISFILRGLSMIFQFNSQLSSAIVA